MRSVVLVVVLDLGACGFTISPGNNPGDDGGSSGDRDDGASCTWAERFDACTSIQPIGPALLDIAGLYIYDTDTRTFTDPAGKPIDHASEDRAGFVLAAFSAFGLGDTSTLRAIGTKPLVFASWSSITIAGTVDVSSSKLGLGAGANASACSVPGGGEADIGGSSGGGGAGFGAIGGKGGDGDSNMNAGGDGSSTGGAGGGAASTFDLRGGCPGANGGDGGLATHGVGGDGGGAIEFAAAASITIGGSIHAGGRGGTGVTSDGGGGGGGSGGYIGLDAALVVASGVLASNGGAGAGGGDDRNVGNAGEDGKPSAVEAIGGTGGSPGGTRGGTGGNVAVLAGATVTDFNTGAGGGGGGSVGVIRVRATTFDATGSVVSPPATMITR